MGYLNPLLSLPAGQALLALPPEQRASIEAVMRELRAQANDEAESAWKRRKGPMAAYWRAVSTYARHLAHALSIDTAKPRARDGAPRSHCDHGQPMPEWFQGGDWGDWRCACAESMAYCQDCGTALDMNSMSCPAHDAGNDS